ncbi:DUF6412 domain-containing protein [Tsukamurella sp. 1534]|uniref:DUF6412 domain-containing protein n=1 Tax=Tsukamurella sp. 1534 TaxID=1151061 RepID=UPI0011D27861|nr:DUF6412 domain-containing protein [Tsukamurella sp. 1534]
MVSRLARVLRRLGEAPLPWIVLAAYVVATLTALDGATALVGIALAVAVAALTHVVVADESGAPSGPLDEGRRPDLRLRGAYRRSSMPNTAGRPRPRAPGMAARAA